MFNALVKYLRDKYFVLKYKLNLLWKFHSLTMLIHSDIQTSIPKSTTLGHNGLGIVIGAGVKLGENCRIRQHVIIGGTGIGDHPTIGDNVNIYPFTVICKKIKIGNNVTIGAFSYIDKDIPDNSFVFGIPFKFQDNQKILIKQCLKEVDGL